MVAQLSDEELVEILRASKCKYIWYRVLERQFAKTLPGFSLRALRYEILGALRLVVPPLERIDVLGVAFAWVFETRLGKYVPVGPLDSDQLGGLHEGAAILVKSAVPEVVEEILANIVWSTEAAQLPENERLLGLIGLWCKRVFIPCVHGPDAPAARHLEPARRQLLNQAWWPIRGLSQLQMPPMPIARSLAKAFSPDPQDALAEMKRTPEYGSAALKLIADNSPGIEYLARDRLGQIVVNARGVRDRLGEKLGTKRRRGKRPLSEADLGSKSQSEEEAAKNPVLQAEAPTLAPEELAALRELRDRRDEAPEFGLGADLLEACRTDRDRLRKALASTEVLLEALRPIQDVAMKAAAAHLLLKDRSRADLAQRFGCSEKAMRLRSADADEAVRAARRRAQ